MPDGAAEAEVAVREVVAGAVIALSRSLSRGVCNIVLLLTVTVLLLAAAEAALELAAAPLLGE